MQYTLLTKWGYQNEKITKAMRYLRNCKNAKKCGLPVIHGTPPVSGEIMKDYKNSKVKEFNALRLALFIVIGLIIINSIMECIS